MIQGLCEVTDHSLCFLKADSPDVAFEIKLH